MKLLPISLHIVKGHSMQPSFNEGDRVITLNWNLISPKKRDVIAFKQNNKSFLKRIVSINQSNITVKGDNKTDSLKISQIQKNSIIGRVVLKY
jgi:phage repressor protein C with HTH and peptisase S24 domain